MKKFNLIEYLTKEAMGYTKQEQRETYHWWDYDTLVSGGDTQWAGYLSVDPSLADVVRDARNFRESKFSDLYNLYGLGKSEMSKMFKVYIGYHITYGAYICSIGPYTGNKVAGRDTFYYGSIRKRKSTKEDMEKTIQKNLNNYMEKFNIQFEPGDLEFVLKSPQDEFRSDRLKQPKTERRYVSLDPNSPSGRELYQDRPIAGDGSFVSLNTRGLTKLISGKWGSIYQTVVRNMASEAGVSEQEIINRGYGNLDFLETIYLSVRKQYQRLVDSGDAAMSGMTPPPIFSKLALQGKSGQVQFNALPTNQRQIRQLGLRKEILELLNSGVNNPAEVQRILNDNPKREKFPLPISEVEDQITEITRLSTEQNKNHATMLTETSQIIESLTEEVGFKDLRTAFEMAKLYYSHQPVDPGTKSKIGLKYAPRMVFDPPENFQNFTSEDLREIREAYIEQKTGIPSETSRRPVATEEELISNIGEATPSTPTHEPAAPEVTTPNQPTSVTDSDSWSREEQEMLNRILGYTVKNLIKIASELDLDGNFSAAEEVHKIIRKYEREI